MRLIFFMLFVVLSVPAASVLTPDGTAQPWPERAVIVIPARPGETEQFAAQLLQDTLKAVSSRSYPVVGEDYIPEGTSRISVGATRLLREAGFPACDLGEAGYAIGEQDGDWFLYGGRRSGPVTAVLALLTEDLGCRWYAPGEAPVIPQTTEIAVVPRSYVPPLMVRDPFFHLPLHASEWSGLNRTNPYFLGDIPTGFGGRFRYSAPYFVHTLSRLFPVAEFGSTHPEYFSLVDGKRVISDHAQRCLGNPEMVDIAVEKLHQAMLAEPDAAVFSVSQNDFMDGWCECTACDALYRSEGSRSGPMLHFVNQVARKIREIHPDKYLSTLAYHRTFQPPATIRPEENVIIVLCTDSHALLDGQWSPGFLTVGETPKFYPALARWAELGAKIQIWDYLLDYDHYPVPQPNLQVLEENIDAFMRHGVIGIMAQASYTSPGASLEALKSWVLAQKLWNPDWDCEALAAEFVAGYYGVCAPHMLAYLELLEKYREIVKASALPAQKLVLPRAFVDEALPLLEQAEQDAGDDAALRRKIRQELFCVRYLAGYLGMTPETTLEKYLTNLDWLRSVKEELGIIGCSEAGYDIFPDWELAARQAALPLYSAGTLRLPQTTVPVPDPPTVLPDPEASAGIATRQPGRNAEWAVRCNLKNYREEIVPERRYLLRLRYRAVPENIAAGTLAKELFTVGCWWGQPDPEAVCVRVKGVPDAKRYRTEIVALVSFHALHDPSWLFFSPRAEAQLEGVYYDTVELIPVEEYRETVPAGLPEWRFGL